MAEVGMNRLGRDHFSAYSAGNLEARLRELGAMHS